MFTCIINTLPGNGLNTNSRINRLSFPGLEEVIAEFLPAQAIAADGGIVLGKVAQLMRAFPLADALMDCGVINSDEYACLSGLESAVPAADVNRDLLGVVRLKSKVLQRLFVKLLIKGQPELFNK